MSERPFVRRSLIRSLASVTAGAAMMTAPTVVARCGERHAAAEDGQKWRTVRVHHRGCGSHRTFRSCSPSSGLISGSPVNSVA